ncbi:hypothetical protein RJ639_019199 [Escallonia herrerae]|uniref:K-box domain-containing protein n=1 Tax=Escallonia herrerae TaxID=1293975 RepID=A0AA88V5Y6_9ASTE|nr:hypothetical protein RJ639_019199 [Escallonia herrerae]
MQRGNSMQLILKRREAGLWNMQSSSPGLRHLMGEDLDSLSLKELQNLEHQLDSALKHIRSKKDKALQEQNTSLAKKVKEKEKQLVEQAQREQPNPANLSSLTLPALNAGLIIRFTSKPYDEGKCRHPRQENWESLRNRRIKIWENMRMKIELNIEEPLPKGVPMKCAGMEDTWIQFRYEWLPDFCFHCGHLGHVKKWYHIIEDPSAKWLMAGELRVYNLWIRASFDEDIQSPVSSNAWRRFARQAFWDYFAQVIDSFAGPWMAIRDFNEVTSSLENSGGRSVASSSNGGLIYVINSKGLIDLGFSGNPFTWNNKRALPANIKERLRKGLGNLQWGLLFPNASIKHLSAILSDHNHILLDTATSTSLIPKPFKSSECWTRDKASYLVIQHAWKIRVRGSASFRLCHKIRNTKKELKAWNLSHFDHIQTKIKALSETLDLLQKEEPSERNMQLRK